MNEIDDLSFQVRPQFVQIYERFEKIDYINIQLNHTS